MVLSVAAAVLAVVTAVGVVVDSRVLTGAPIWLKPFKFAVSFVLYGGDARLDALPAAAPQPGREWSAVVIVAVAVVENGGDRRSGVTRQTSHFNDTTPLNAALFAAMGVAIMVLFVAHLVIADRGPDPADPDRAAATAAGGRLGLSLLGMLAAVPMVLPMQDPGIEGIAGAHSVGVPDGGPGLPIVGWSTTGGDLRIGHFVGLHALQALPILAILLSRFATAAGRAHPRPAAGRRGRRVRRTHSCC